MKHLTSHSIPFNFTLHINFIEHLISFYLPHKG